MLVLAMCMGGVTFAELLGFGGTGSAEAAAVKALLVGVVVNAGLGGVLLLAGKGGRIEFLGRRDALLLVALTWIIGAGTSAVPFYAWSFLREPIGDGLLSPHVFSSVINCYFESMSGLTTTGASVLSDVESLPKGLLLWRATTHWLGGLGIVVLFVAVLPLVGAGGKRMMQFETTGPTKAGVRPRIRETARALWLIYLGMTVALAILLWLCDMSVFDSICHTFATLGTGGYSTRNASIAAYDSVWIDVVITLFMVLAGVNFGLYYQLLNRHFKEVYQDTELRAYLMIVGGATLLIASMLVGQKIVTTAGLERVADVGQAIRYAAFQAVSIQTTTGYGTADFNLWPFAAKSILVLLMFVGGCAGSTGGGIKVVRIVLVIKVLAAEVERVFRPTVVRTIRLGRHVVDPEVRQAVLCFTLIMLALWVCGTLLIHVFEPTGSISFVTSATASVATLMNIGPGLHMVGPTQNFGFFQPESKVVMCVLMALGRLEVYALLVLVLPRFWRGN